MTSARSFRDSVYHVHFQSSSHSMHTLLWVEEGTLGIKSILDSRTSSFRIQSMSTENVDITIRVDDGTDAWRNIRFLCHCSSFHGTRMLRNQECQYLLNHARGIGKACPSKLVSTTHARSSYGEPRGPCTQFASCNIMLAEIWMLSSSGSHRLAHWSYPTAKKRRQRALA